MTIWCIEWQRKGWIPEDSPDNRGWFQWYCRYWIGRRCDDDERQVVLHNSYICYSQR
jgi:hypothetical protein